MQIRIIFLLAVCVLLHSSGAQANTLKNIEQKIEESKHRPSQPKATPTVNPTPIPIGNSLDAGDAEDRGLAALITGLFNIFDGAGSPDGKRLRGTLYAHGATNVDDLHGFDFAAQAAISRLYMKLDYEQLFESDYSLASFRMKLGYSLGFGPVSVAAFIGPHFLLGEYDNSGLLFGGSLDWHLTEKIRTEFLAETTGFNNSHLNQYVFTGQYQIEPNLFADLGVRHVRLAGENVNYTIYFTGLRLTWEQ